MSSGLFESIRISASGMRGQRVKMDVVSQNLANAETTRTEDGTPYRRQRAVFEQILDRKLGRLQALRERGVGGLRGPRPRGIEVSVNTALDASDFRVVHDPGHPDADAEGYVLMPNVNVITEMVDMITASRAYEANLSAARTAKEMFKKALDI